MVNMRMSLSIKGNRIVKLFFQKQKGVSKANANIIKSTENQILLSRSTQKERFEIV